MQFCFRGAMLGCAVLICSLLGAVPPLSARAEQIKPPTNSTVHAAEKDGAEKVFASTASKVVFLITRSSGESRAHASGIILTADGYIATNYHALQGADAVEIRFFPDPGNSQDYLSFNGAKLLYADAERDIAIMKVTTKSLPFLECPARTGCQPRVGENVYAIGNPKGLTNTISGGIVSALRRDGGENIIQHTAPISPGSSGGALVDSDGNLLGMNSWQVADGQNLNFAISAKHLLESLETARHATTALDFPPEAPAEDAYAPADRAWQAFQSRDYIQAANQAEQAVASGTSNSKIYFVLGRADIELGKKEEAERYLRQALALGGPDDKFKQSSRYGLLTLLTARLNTGTSVDRLALLRLAEDFLESNAGSVEDADLYSKMRAWAASLPEPIRSITGTWTASAVLNLASCPGSITIRAFENGGFTLSGFGSSETINQLRKKLGIDPGPWYGDVLCELEGKVAPSGDGFVGEITRKVSLMTRYGLGEAEQTLPIHLNNLSPDLKKIEGTTTGGKITKRGNEGKGAADILDFPPNSDGSRGPWHFTLYRGG